MPNCAIPGGTLGTAGFRHTVWAQWPLAISDCVRATLATGFYWIIYLAMKIEHLKIATSLIVAIFVVVIASVFLSPQSSFAFLLERFQTLFTGVFAGLAALATAVWVYLAAKLPIKAELERAAEKKRVMKRAGAAQLISLIRVIHSKVLTEGGKSQEERLGSILTPDMMPSLETIGTQDNEVIKELAVFLMTAFLYEAHAILKSRQKDDVDEHPKRKVALEKLKERGSKLVITLVNILDEP
jgi:hypothetical protein